MAIGNYLINVVEPIRQSPLSWRNNNKVIDVVMTCSFSLYTWYWKAYKQCLVNNWYKENAKKQSGRTPIWHFCISFQSVKGHTIVERFVCKYQWRISCVWQITNMVCTWAIIETLRMQKLHLIHLVIFTLATIILKDYWLNAKRRNRLHIFLL